MTHRFSWAYPCAAVLACWGCSSSGGGGVSAQDAGGDVHQDAGVSADAASDSASRDGSDGGVPTESCKIDTSTDSGQWDPTFYAGWHNLGAMLSDAARYFTPDGGVLFAGQERNSVSTGVKSGLVLVSLDAAGKLRGSFGNAGIARYEDGHWYSRVTVWTDPLLRPTLVTSRCNHPSVCVESSLVAFRLVPDATALESSFGSGGQAPLAPAEGSCALRGSSPDGAAVLLCTVVGSQSKTRGVVMDAMGNARVMDTGTFPQAAAPQSDGTWLVLTQGIGDSSGFVERWSSAQGALPVVGNQLRVSVPDVGFTKLRAIFADASGAIHTILGTAAGNMREDVIDSSGSVSLLRQFDLPISEAGGATRLCDGRFVLVKDVASGQFGVPHLLRVSHYDEGGALITTRGVSGVTEVQIEQDIAQAGRIEVDPMTGRVMVFATSSLEPKLWVGRLLP